MISLLANAGGQTENRKKGTGNLSKAGKFASLVLLALAMWFAPVSESLAQEDDSYIIPGVDIPLDQLIGPVDDGNGASATDTLAASPSSDVASGAAPTAPPADWIRHEKFGMTFSTPPDFTVKTDDAEMFELWAGPPEPRAAAPGFWMTMAFIDEDAFARYENPFTEVTERFDVDLGDNTIFKAKRLVTGMGGVPYGHLTLAILSKAPVAGDKHLVINIGSTVIEPEKALPVINGIFATLKVAGSVGAAEQAPAPQASTAQPSPPQSPAAPATSMAAGTGPINIMPWFGGDCEAVDMATWSHPTRQVLETSPAVDLQFVWLCDDKQLRVFGVSLEYDPRAISADFFYPLYLDLHDANDQWPFDIFDVTDNLDIGVVRDGDSGIFVDIREIDIGDAAGATTPAQPADDPSTPSLGLSGPQGTYNADWGDGQDTPTQFAAYAGGGVHASYSDGASDGTMSHIDGSLQGTSFVGRWQEPLSGRRCDDNAYWGRLAFEFSPDFGTFTGHWGYCDAEPSRSIEGARDSGAPAPVSAAAPLNGIGASGVTVDFANGMEGWTSEYTELTARPSGGPNGRGVLEVYARGDGKNGYLIAPVSLLGDWSGATGLRINIKTEGGTYFDAFDDGAYGDIYLASGEKSAAIAFPENVGTDWTTEQVSFDDPDWKLNGGAQSVYDVIADLATFRVRGEYINGDVTAWLSSIEVLSGNSAGPISESILGKQTPIAPRTNAATDPALELAFWDAVKDSTDPADFQAYLDQYPNGAFAALAKIRIKRHGDESIPKVTSPESQQLLNEGWWVILASLPTEPWERQQTDFQNMQSAAAPCGLDVFNDLSGKFKGFRAGYNVFVLGAFESQSAANKKLEQAQTCFPDSYVKYGEYLGE